MLWQRVKKKLRWAEGERGLQARDGCQTICVIQCKTGPYPRSARSRPVAQWLTNESNACVSGCFSAAKHAQFSWLLLKETQPEVNCLLQACLFIQLSTPEVNVCFRLRAQHVQLQLMHWEVLAVLNTLLRVFFCKYTNTCTPYTCRIFISREFGTSNSSNLWRDLCGSFWKVRPKFKARFFMR